MYIMYGFTNVCVNKPVSQIVKVDLWLFYALYYILIDPHLPFLIFLLGRYKIVLHLELLGIEYCL